MKLKYSSSPRYLALILILFVLQSHAQGVETYQSASNFVRERLLGIGITDITPSKAGEGWHNVWTVLDADLSSKSVWRWTESWSVYSDKWDLEYRAERMKPNLNQVYTVDPRQLVTRVAVRGRRVKIECASLRCIRKESQYDEREVKQVAQNYWFFPDSSTAQRVAKALEFMLKQAAEFPNSGDTILN